MIVFLIRRLMQSAVVLFVMSVLVFVGIFQIGSPVEILASPDATAAEVAEMSRRLGLDQPLWTQYLRFLQGALSGDLGRSFVFGTPAIELILERMPATFELAILAMAIAIGLGIPLGILAGLKPESVLGRGIMAGSILGFSLPSFWVGLMLILVFSVQLGWLPSTGRGETVEFLGIRTSLLTWDGLAHAILPATNLALFKLALVTRLTQAGVRETMLLDYVKFARAKGLHPARIVGVHVVKNMLIPVVTVVGLEFGSLVAFAVVTETIFAWPGMGKLIIDAIYRLDRPVVVAYLMVIVVLFIVINLLVDIAYSLLDPRVRLSEARQ
jgi:peptide/nickel transport system permease protein